LEELLAQDVVRISSGELGQIMDVTPSQIRQDLSCFGEFGQQGYGYKVDMLVAEISAILGVNRERLAIVVGAGNLGRALIGKFPFELYGVRLSAAFDLSPDIVGTEIGGVPVRHIDELEAEIRKTPPDIAVLTMSSESANAIAKRLIDAGVRGIWNFTNVDLTVTGAEVIIENLHFSDSLLTLSYYMTHGKNKGKSSTDNE